jgi:hypothetical protein
MIKTLVEYENGGKIDVYDLVNQTTSDFKRVYACCEHFAAQGKYVLITPHFAVTKANILYNKIYASLFGTPFWGMCPDFCVDGVWYEHEGYDTKKDLSDKNTCKLTFSNMIRRGLTQSERVIVEDCSVTLRYAKRNIFKRIHFEKQNISEVYIRTENGLILVHKK